MFVLCLTDSSKERCFEHRNYCVYSKIVYQTTDCSINLRLRFVLISLIKDVWSAIADTNTRIYEQASIQTYFLFCYSCIVLLVFILGTLHAKKKLRRFLWKHLFLDCSFKALHNQRYSLSRRAMRYAYCVFILLSHRLFHSLVVLFPLFVWKTLK